MRYTYHRRRKPRFRINNQIRVPQVRLIDENGQQIGILPTYKALKIAQEKNFALVEVSPKANPPVVKILDWGQFRYKLNKKIQKQKIKLKKIAVKGLRLSLRISSHDLELKKNQAIKFLKRGNKVKIEMVLRGRERQHSDLAQEIINKFIQSLEEVTVEQSLTRQGGRFTIVVKSK